MSETPDQPTKPVVSQAPEEPTAEQQRRVPDLVVVPEPERRTSRVVTAAAWVGIVAGIVFVVAVIFFSGFILGKHSDGGGEFAGPGSGRHHDMMFERGFTSGPPMLPERPGDAGPQQPAPPAPPARP